MLFYCGFFRSLSIAALLLVVPVASQQLLAQDTRTVTEPVIPPTCVHLEARLQATAGHLAAADEHALDTERIQQAIDRCPKGHAVELAPAANANAFLSGPIELPAGITLLIDHGATLFGSRDPRVYAVSPGSCGLVNMVHGAGCRPLIAVTDAAGVGIMGDGVIDGRGGETLIDPPSLPPGAGSVTWWQLAEMARTSGHQQVPRLIIANHADDFTLYRITLKNSANFHVVYNHGNGFTVWGVKIDTPKRGARNTDGIDPGGSKNVTITHSFIRAGDDNIALKAGDAPMTNVTISHNHFYWGHGMSIGSETSGGASAIRVTDLSLDGPDNGIRIKSNASRGGLVHDVVYDDVCIRDSPNPIFLDSGYTAAGSLSGSLYPTFRDITLRDVRISGGGQFSFDGYSSEHRVGLNLDGVQITDAAATTPKYSYRIEHADLHLGPGGVNLALPTGAELTKTDSTITGTMTSGPGASCAEKFVPFPAQ